MPSFKLLTPYGGNAKVARNTGRYAPFVLHLAPAGMAGRGNVCPGASPECVALCLNYSGRAAMMPKSINRNTILAARVRKTRMYFDERESFLARLKREIELAIDFAKRRSRIPVFRLNGTSDLDWSDIIREFPNVQFYDYTKDAVRMHQWLLGRLPPNYHLTFSFSGRNQEVCESCLNRGGNVAVTFARPIGRAYVMPKTWHGFPVINGDISDLRFLDIAAGNGIVVALKAKGLARKANNNPFVESGNRGP